MPVFDPPVFSYPVEITPLIYYYYVIMFFLVFFFFTNDSRILATCGRVRRNDLEVRILKPQVSYRFLCTTRGCNRYQPRLRSFHYIYI